MAKGCGACGKLHGYSMLECIQGQLPAPTVEKIPQPELPSPQSTVHVNTGTVHRQVGTVPKNRAWEQRNSEQNRAWRREYDRKRRAHEG